MNLSLPQFLDSLSVIFSSSQAQVSGGFCAKCGQYLSEPAVHDRAGFR
jgi:hypothetical protein